MYSVILTDLMLYVLLVVSSIGIAFIALKQTSYEQIQAAVPEVWSSIFVGWNLDVDWDQFDAGIDGAVRERSFVVVCVVCWDDVIERDRREPGQPLALATGCKTSSRQGSPVRQLWKVGG